MDINSFQLLLTREGKWALESAMAFEPREKDFLSEFSMLAKRFPRELARAALTVAILRLEAENKFPKAERMYFTREALEQATPWIVSQHRAQRYAGNERIFDLGCSIGSDALALANHAPTIGVELDPLRTQMAKANATALRANASFTQGDVHHLPFKLTAQDAIFADPARRANGKRVFSVEGYTPSLSIVNTWLTDTQKIGIKISPGVKLHELHTYDCEVEFISLNGELKEAMLWFGPFKGPAYRATLLDRDGNLQTMTRDGESPTIPITKPQSYIYEPDPAILRAGLVTDLGEKIDGAQLDPEIAYITNDTLTATPFARVWEVEDWLPFQLKNLRATLRERNVGRVTVKKRGSPILPEELIQGLRLEGEEEKVIFLTQLRGKPIVIIAK